jgi:hypothetical protein
MKAVTYQGSDFKSGELSMADQTEVVTLTKMSIKTLNCNPRKAAALPEGSKEAVRLCVIGGKADGVKVGEDSTGRPWSALTGSFEGVNLETGEVFGSGKLFLPSGIQESVESVVKHNEGKAVSFALELRAVKASNPIGYSYQAVSLMPAAAVDELSEIRVHMQKSVMGATQKTLPPASKK